MRLQLSSVSSSSLQMGHSIQSSQIRKHAPTYCQACVVRCLFLELPCVGQTLSFLTPRTALLGKDIQIRTSKRRIGPASTLWVGLLVGLLVGLPVGLPVGLLVGLTTSTLARSGVLMNVFAQQGCVVSKTQVPGQRKAVLKRDIGQQRS